MTNTDSTSALTLRLGNSSNIFNCVASNAAGSIPSGKSYVVPRKSGNYTRKLKPLRLTMLTKLK